MSETAIDVYLIQVDGHYYVRPGTFVVPAGAKEVLFRNLTRFGATLVFDAWKQRVDLPAGGTGTLKVRRGRESEAISYRALLPEIDVSALGNSSPILIIER